MSAMSIKAAEQQENLYVCELEDKLIEIEMRLDRLLGLTDDKSVDPEVDREALDRLFKQAS